MRQFNWNWKIIRGISTACFVIEIILFIAYDLQFIYHTETSSKYLLMLQGLFILTGFVLMTLDARFGDD